MTERFFPRGTPDFLNFDSTASGPDAHAHNRPRTSPAARPRPNPVDRVIVPYPGDVEGSLWDYVTLDGTQFPGLATVSGSGASLKLDSRSAPGSNGARLKHKGYEASEFDIKFSIWTREQFEQLETLIPLIHPRNSPRSGTALPIYHPSLALLLVDMVVVKSVSPLVPAGEPDVWTFSIKVVEWAPPTNTNTGANGAGSRVVRAPVSIAVETAFPPPRTAPATAPPPSSNSNP